MLEKGLQLSFKERMIGNMNAEQIRLLSVLVSQKLHLYSQTFLLACFQIVYPRKTKAYSSVDKAEVLNKQSNKEITNSQKQYTWIQM